MWFTRFVVYWLSIVLGPPGWLTFLCKNDNGSTIYKAKLQNPIESIVKIEANENCQRVAYSNGLVCVLGNSLVYFYALETLLYFYALDVKESY